MNWTFEKTSSRKILASYLHERLRLTGIVGDLGCERLFGVPIQTKPTVLLKYVVGIDYEDIRIEHVWIKIAPHQRHLFTKGKEIRFEAIANTYDDGRRWKYGLQFVRTY